MLKDAEAQFIEWTKIFHCMNTLSTCRLHAITVSDNAAYFYDHCDQTLKEIGLDRVKSRDMLRMVDGYKGTGYGVSTDEELGNMAFWVFRSQSCIITHLILHIHT